ncbi:MAG: sialate O-acetylesterase [Planctomycetota bacterium]|nr:sialate O-acetylesterase [Planctomycetota bacterium]
MLLNNFLPLFRPEPLLEWKSFLLFSGCILFLITQQDVAAQAPVKSDTFQVFLLAGQSNMEGQGVVDLDHPKYYNSGKGILKNVMKNPKRAELYRHIVDGEGNFITREDVFVRFVTRTRTKTGGLSIGFTGYDGKHHIGPEFQFGHVVGDAIGDPVLLIKTAWGGKSLYQDFRPPSATGETGPYYTRMIREIREALKSCEKEFPQLKGKTPVIRGFVWFQGWNDMFNQDALKEYEANLVCLVRDVRKEFGLSELPVVIGELGNGGEKAGQNMKSIRRAQKNATLNHGLKNVLFVPTTSFARPASESPNISHGHHWFGNAESYFLVGNALGKAMLELLSEDRQPN